jgi:hypothetical protein
MSDRRISPRVPLNGTVLFDTGTEVCETRIVDASETGLCVIVVRGRLIQGETYNASVSIDDHFESLPILTTIVWVSQEKVGLQCSGMGHEAAELFRNAVSDALVSRAVSYDRFAHLTLS